jgi:hypothetical protein
MMPPEKYANAKEIFYAAIEIEANEREAYLRESCAGDDELLELVNSLVEADKIAQKFLEKSPLPETLETEKPGKSPEKQRIGPYKIVKGIGRGGMGAVYLAVRDDDSFKKAGGAENHQTGDGFRRNPAAL